MVSQRFLTAVVLGVTGLVLSATPALAASAGHTHTCAVNSSGAPVCWGGNDDGQTTIPPGIGTVTQVVAGLAHTCAIKTDGTPVCWGRNTDQQANTTGVGSVTQISAGGYHTCAIKTDGTPTCWGDAVLHQTEIPPGAGTVTQLDAGFTHSCAIKTGGALVCWGDNTDHQTDIPPEAASVTQISAGGYHTCAIKTDDNPVCWGWNGEGETTIPPGTGTVTQISAGHMHTCAIKTGGVPVCWGDNSKLQSTIPPGLGTITQISAGFLHTCAVKTGGGVVCWGDNGTGQRGAPPAITSSPPPAGANHAYVHTVTASGTFTSAFAVTAGALPPGLSLDSASGQITGTPTTSGTYAGTISASDGVFADATQAFSITIDFGAPSGGGGGGPVVVQPPADTTGPVVVIPGRLKTLAARSGVVLFRYGAALEDTTGVVALKSGGTLGSARFSAAKGKAVVVRIKLSAKAKKTLAKRHKLKIQAAITVRDAAGNATMKVFKVTLVKAK